MLHLLVRSGVVRGRTMVVSLACISYVVDGVQRASTAFLRIDSVGHIDT